MAVAAAARVAVASRVAVAARARAAALLAHHWQQLLHVRSAARLLQAPAQQTPALQPLVPRSKRRSESPAPLPQMRR